MPSEKRQFESTIFGIEIKGHKVFMTYNGKTTEFKKSFWMKLTLSDLLEYTKERLK